MGLKNITATEHFEFTTAQELKEFLNGFEKTDLDAVQFECGLNDFITLHWETEELSDGSEVTNARIA